MVEKAKDVKDVKKEEVKLTVDVIRKAVSAAKDITLEEMEIPEWNTTIWISALTYKERNAALKGASLAPDREFSTEEAQKFFMQVIITGVRDSEGNKVFTQNDVEMLMNKNSAVIDRIGAKVTDVSGFAPEIRDQVRRRFRKG